MADHRARVIIEGDSTSYVSAAAKATRSTEDMRASTEKAKKSAEGLGSTVKKASDPLVELSKNATRSGASMVQLGQSAFNVAKAFGGWGVAVAIVGDLLLGLVESSNKATEAAEKQKRALREQRAAAQDLENADKVESFRRREASIAEGKAKAEEYAARVKIAETAEELRGIEDALAQFGRKKDNLALQRRETEIRAENLRIVGDTAGALELERKEELRIIALLGEKEKAAKRASAAMKGGNALGEAGAQRALGFSGFRGNVAGASAAMQFDAEAGRVGAMQRAGSDTRSANDAQYAADARLRAIEIERATTGETLSLIAQEEDARRRLLQTQIESATTGAERAEIQGQIEEVQHEARLRRIAVEQAAEEKRMARRAALYSLAEQLSTGAVNVANMAAKTAGASAKKQEAIAAGTAGAQAIFIGALEQVKAIAAFASFNFVQGAAHQAAAVFAFAQGGMLLAQAGGAGRGGGGGSMSGGGGMPSGGSQAQPSGQTFRGGDSAIPGSPGPQAPTAVGSGGAPNRKVEFHFHGDVVGTPRKELIRTIREGIDLDRQGGRTRRTGTDD